MHQSQRSKQQYLPRFPRLQLMRRRRLEQEEFTTYVDSEFMIHVRPNSTTKH